MFGGPPKLGVVLPSFLQGMMRLSTDQKKQLTDAEKALGEKLEKLLTDEQKKKFAEGPGGFGPGSMPAPGQLIASAVVEKLKLSEEQTKKLAEIQKEADEKLDGLFNDDQKKQFKQMKDFAKGFAGGPPGGGRGGPPGFGPPGGGGFPGFGPPGGSGLFRAPRYAPDYAGLAGRELKGEKTIEEIQAVAKKDPPKESKEKEK
jgi:hypothetical protein